MTAARNPALGVSVGIPAPWVLTLVKGKRPYRPQWQTEKPLGRAFIEGEMQSGHATGLGLRLGEVSGGLVAVDLDGPSTSDYLKVNGWDLPPTVGWTSGKTGRAQWLYQIPKSLWENLDNRKVLETGIEGEQVEIRWNHHQSVLPPSVHPETGKPYQWLTSPDVAPVAPAPAWLVELLTRPPREERKVIEFPVQDTSWGDIDRARSYLAALKPYRADDYQTWIAVGMALKDVSDDLLPDWDNWSANSAKYKPGECDRRWESFKRDGVGQGTLGKLAKEDGWVSPKRGKTRRATGQSATAQPETGATATAEGLTFDEDYTEETRAALERLNEQ